jgi:hypothetical protein
MRIRTTVMAAAAFVLLWSAPAAAQERHIVDPAAMRQAVADQVATDQENRAAVLGVLQHPQVRELADRLGLTVTRAENAVAGLSSAELTRLADTARAAGAQLAGGHTVVISLTTLLLIIIIILLIA